MSSWFFDLMHKLRWNIAHSTAFNGTSPPRLFLEVSFKLGKTEIERNNCVLMFKAQLIVF